jgi:hypothetical protein
MNGRAGSRWHGRRTVVGFILAFVVGVAGCAGIPSTGPVERVADDAGLAQSTVRYAPVGPPRGASPQQIVRGYLDAMLAYPVSTGTAALYLTPDAAKAWRSSEGVTVYVSPRVTLPESDDGLDPTAISVELRTDEVARLDRQGHYTRSTNDPMRTYRLEKVDGQWRIANPQSGVMVTSTYYESYFRPFSLYFFDATGERLVPDLVHLAVGDQLATGLVTALARGPGRTPGSLRTYVPEAGSLRPSVTVGDAGVADVEFSASFTRLSAAARDRLAAQIVWTLRSVPGLRGMRIFGGTAILSSRGERIHPVDSWAGFGPPAAKNHTYALVDDKLVEIDDATVKPVTGAWGRDAAGAVEAAVSDDAVAAVLPGRDRVRVTDRAGRDRLEIGGTRFVAPWWDFDDRLWLLDRAGGSSRVRVVEEGDVRALSIGSLRGVTVRSFALSPDGARYAVAATDGGDQALFVGPVRRDKDDRVTSLGDPRRLSIGVSDPHSVDWVSTTRLGFLGASDAGVQLYDVGLDGTDLLGGDTGGGPLLPDVDAIVLTGRTGEDSARWVLDAQRRLWHRPPDGAWRLIDDRRFSGLSTGD